MTKEELHAKKLAEVKRQIDGARDLYRRYLAVVNANRDKPK